MKKLKTAFSILFLLTIGVFLFIWIETELAFREELENRPAPSGLYPIVEENRDFLVAKAAELGIDLIITDGYRSPEEQQGLHNQGRNMPGAIVTYAAAGESYHNYGLAIDYALRLDDGSVVWDIERDDNGNGKSDWFEVAAIGKSLGFDWGGDWQRFKDYPHLEMTFGLSIRDLQQGWRPEDKIK